MFEKKSVILVSVILLTLLGAPVAASAATPTPIHLDDETEYSDDHDEDGDSDADHHDELHEVIPPVITVPGFGSGHHKRPPRPIAPTDPVVTVPDETGTTTTAQSIKGSDIANAEYVVIASDDTAGEIPLEVAHPIESKPIDVKLIRAEKFTPADQFMESAYIGMGVLGVAALGLGVTASLRAVRIRRAGKADYFYDNK